MAKTKSKVKPSTDREFLEQSLYWPRWPMLPLVARNGNFNSDEATGFLFSHSQKPDPIVYFSNVYRINKIADEIKAETGRQEVVWGQLLAKLKHRVFDSLDEVLVHYRID